MVASQSTPINYLTPGTEVDVFIDVTTNEDSGYQRVEVRDDNEELIIGWTNTNADTTVDIRYVGFNAFVADATIRLCDVCKYL